MVKLSLNSTIFAITIFLFGIFYCNSSAFAADSKINAGILSDIWFSSLTLDKDQSVIVYSSFQNSEESDLSGTVSFWINENKINTLDFNAVSKKIIKLESPWNTEVGDFEIKIVIDSLVQNGAQINPQDLIKKEAKLKIKINRKIDIEYITGVGANVYNNAVKTIDRIVENTNERLEGVKARDTSINGTVAGIQYTNDDTGSDRATNGTVAGIQYTNDDTGSSWANEGNKATSNENIQVKKDDIESAKNSSLSSLKNIFIEIVQFLLKHWQITSITLLALLVLWFFRRSKY